MNAAPASASDIQPLTKDEINALPMLSYEGDIILVQTKNELECALKRLQNETVLGFDTEARPSFKKGKSYPTALVQLAGTAVVVLIRLPHTPFSERLADLLARPDIIKAGVAIRDDICSLQRLHSFEPGGLVELADMARRLHIRAQGLRTLTACLMGGRISKSAQCSNWEKKVLTPQQIRYAATDAWIGREIYLKLKEIESMQKR